MGSGFSIRSWIRRWQERSLSAGNSRPESMLCRERRLARLWSQRGERKPGRRRAKGERVILVRRETSPEDVGGMFVAQGILTATGGKTSHAAVVARGWGKCC